MEQAKQADKQAIFLASVLGGLWFTLRRFLLCNVSRILIATDRTAKQADKQAIFLLSVLAGLCLPLSYLVLCVC